MKISDYYEIQVAVRGHKPMRELLQATCKLEALQKGQSKYRYIDAVVKLVPDKAAKLKLTRSSDNPARRHHRAEVA